MFEKKYISEEQAVDTIHLRVTTEAQQPTPPRGRRTLKN